MWNCLSKPIKSFFTFFDQFSHVHGLIACGGEDGAVECFDLRRKSSVGRINAVMPAGDVDHVMLWPIVLSLYMMEILYSFFWQRL